MGEGECLVKVRRRSVLLRQLVTQSKGLPRWQVAVTRAWSPEPLANLKSVTPHSIHRVTITGQNDMSNCTSRKDDWKRFSVAVLKLVTVVVPMWDALKTLWPHVAEVLHTGKNIVVEELRRWGLVVRGKSC